VLGTPAYMSPEQIAGLAVDGRADLYALGVLLFHLLCARLPYEAETLGALMNRIATQAPPDLRDLRPDAPEALAAIVARLLAKRPEARPAHADALIEALQSVRHP
jgi:eukaryotic-like serine/threonine-protein kinase